MAAVRENILTSGEARTKFLDGVRILDEDMTDVTAQDVFQFLTNNGIPLGMQGIQQPLSMYDLFVLWHVVAMRIAIPPGNAAHGGPIFLPWHRMYLIRLEQQLQFALNDPDFGLPYWDWAEDGELPVVNQWQTPLWSPTHLGESRGSVQSGPIGSMRVRLFQDPFTGNLLSVNPRRLQRQAGLDQRNRALPTQGDVRAARADVDYDRAPWSQSAMGHRNRLEGWINGPQLHNLIHVWIGGDMSPGTSPNDPVFFLNHCNVDRIWEAWMANEGRKYRPLAGEGPVGHRIDDLMVAIIGEGLRPSEVLDPSAWYSYDSLTVD